MNTVPTKQRRRYLSYSLRTLLIVVSICAVGLGYIANRAQQQRRAVAIVAKYHGQVFYEHELDSLGRPRANFELPGPAWLRRWLGGEYFDRATRVRIDGRNKNTETVGKTTAAELSQLGHLTSLKELYLITVPVTDDVLRNFSGLQNLESLMLLDTLVSDAGLPALAGCTKLKALCIRQDSVKNRMPRPEVTDRGLAFVARLNALEELELNDTQVSDGTLRRLQGFPKLSRLQLAGTAITDAGLAVLPTLPALTNINLNRTGITDEGLKHLGASPRLNNIQLNNTAVTDAGLAHLEQLPLKYLRLVGTPVTRTGFNRIRKLHPKADIFAPDAGIMSTRQEPLEQQNDIEAGRTMHKPQPSTSYRPASKRLRYSLRTLLVVLTVFGIWFGYIANRAHRQRQVAEIVEQYGGMADYRNAMPWAPKWLLRRLGNHHFLIKLSNIEFGFDTNPIYRRLSEFSDAELELICSSPALESLRLSDEIEITDQQLKQIGQVGTLNELIVYGPITDPGMKSIAKLSGLQILRMARNRPRESNLPYEALAVTDEGVEYLAQCVNLTQVALRAARITDRGLAKLAGLQSLVALDVDDTLITDAGIAEMRRLPQLAAISVARTQLTDKSLETFCELSKLDRLNIAGAAITDAGLAQLGRLSKLRTLVVDGTPIEGTTLAQIPTLSRLFGSDTNIGDEGMQTIAKMANLDILDLHGTQVTDAGIAPLAGHAKLRQLVLSKTQVTDACLPFLTALPLTMLNVEDTAVTEAAVAPLRAKGIKVWTSEQPYPR